MNLVHLKVLCEKDMVVSSNHATGFGLKSSSVYHFYGHQAYIESLKNIFL